MGGVLARDQRSHHCHGPSKATILLHLHLPPTSPLLPRPCCHGELALSVGEPERSCAAPCEAMGWREWRKERHLVKLSPIIPTPGWEPQKRMLCSVWCCVSWLLVKKGLGQRGQVWLRPPCSVRTCRCSCVGYSSPSHRLTATLLTRLELGACKSGFGHQKLSKHSLSTASGLRPSGGQGSPSLPEVLEHQVLKLPPTHGKGN